MTKIIFILLSHKNKKSVLTIFLKKFVIMCCMSRINFLYFAVFFASLSGLLSGFDTGVISGAMLYINQSFEMSPEISGLLVSSVSIGAVIGALINGRLVDKLGRKNILLLSAVIFILGSVFCAVSQNVTELILSRTLVGCAVGIVNFAGPLYLSEISIREKRGSIVSFYQIALTFGILLSYLINYFCAHIEYTWRAMLFMGAIPAIVLFLGMIAQSDTPRWYVLKGKFDSARKILRKINPKTNLDEEIEAIKHTLNQDEKIKLSKKIIMPFVIGIGIMFVQIATGINAIIYYAPTIFKMLNFSSNQDALFITIFIGLINFLMTFVAFALVDELGRKPLLYIGLSGMLFSLLVLSSVFVLNCPCVKYLAVIFCAVYIVSFSMSLGPIGLLLISEVFPLRYRGSAMSVAIISNFLFNFIVTGLFPISLSRLGGCTTFLIFALICVFSIFFVRFIVPETKGLSLEELEEKWSE